MKHFFLLNDRTYVKCASELNAQGSSFLCNCYLTSQYLYLEEKGKMMFTLHEWFWILAPYRNHSGTWKTKSKTKATTNDAWVPSSEVLINLSGVGLEWQHFQRHLVMLTHSHGWGPLSSMPWVGPNPMASARQMPLIISKGTSTVLHFCMFWGKKR